MSVAASQSSRVPALSLLQELTRRAPRPLEEPRAPTDPESRGWRKRPPRPPSLPLQPLPLLLLPALLVLTRRATLSLRAKAPESRGRSPPPPPPPPPLTSALLPPATPHAVSSSSPSTVLPLPPPPPPPTAPLPLPPPLPVLSPLPSSLPPPRLIRPRWDRLPGVVTTRRAPRPTPVGACGASREGGAAEAAEGRARARPDAWRRPREPRERLPFGD